MVGNVKLRTEANMGINNMHEGDGKCKTGELGCKCTHADDRRPDTSNLMGYVQL